MSATVRAVDPALGYGDMDQIKAMLTTTGTVFAPSDEARLTELNLVLSLAFDDATGRTFGVAGTEETRLVYAKGGTMLVLPKPVWAVTSIGTGGTVDGDEMTGDAALDASAWRVGIEDHAGQIRALEILAGLGSNQPVNVTARWCDADQDDVVPADVSFAVERLVCETFKLENIPVVTEDGVVVPRFDPWLDPTVVKTINTYRLRDLVL
jgi:hypothetical protein